MSPPSCCWLPLCYLESASSCGLLRSFAILDVSVSLIPARHSWGARLGHPHSVLGPLSAVHYCTPSQSGWQICSARCPDPALPSPVAGNALATSRVPCPHTCQLHVSRSICHLASGPYASHSSLKLRPVYLHSMWCPSTSVQHCAPYTPGWLIAMLDIQASPSQLTHRSLLHILEGAPATPVPCLHLAKAPLPLGSPSLLRSYGSLHTYSAVGSSILTAVATHSTPLRLDVYYISLQLQQASAQYIPTLTLGTFRHRTAGTFPVPSFWASFYWSPKRNWQGCLYRC